MVRYIDIAEEDQGQRLDNYLIRELKGVPRGHVYKVIRSGEVRINGARSRPSTRLQAGDRIRIPPIRTSSLSPPRPAEGMQSVLLQSVIYQDDDILALDKPPGIAVHAGSSITSGIVEQLRLALQQPRLELVHRLDRDTSGCLLLAKKPSVLKALQSEFRTRRVKKIYELIVVGSWSKKDRVITDRLERYETSWGERRVRVSSQGQTAQTDFEIIRSKNTHSWLQARLHTGRTHQIRVHTQSRQCPIVGDDKYGDHGQDIGLMLHATRLHIPWSGDVLKLEAPVAERFGEFWETIG